MSGLPLLFTATGPVTTPPAVLQQNLITLVAASAPGYTAALPGILIGDLSGTTVGALSTLDQARVDTVNSVSPYTANAYILAMQGAMLGVPQGQPANGSVLEVFSGSPGYVIPGGFIFGDGMNQYSVQYPGGIIGAGGSSPALYSVATNSGVFAIPANSCTTVISAVPSPYTLTCTNPSAGIAATSLQTIESYRAQVIQAEQVAMTGTQAYLKTLLELVPGVSPRLVSVPQVGQAWEVICGGGDPYLTANAIYQSGVNIGLLAASSVSARNVNVSFYDAPNTYNLVFINPPQQTVTCEATWNTGLSNFTSATIVNQYMIATIQSYINSITVGQPINLLVLSEQIAAAITPVLLPINLTRLVFTVTINGTPVTPTSGTYVIPSDPESYFQISASGASAVQG